MTQERGPGELSAEEIAFRIGAVGAAPPELPQPPPVQRAEPLPPPRLAELRPAIRPPMPVDRPVMPVNRPSVYVDRVPKPVARPPEPRVRLIRDTAATLLGLSAVALIVLAVMPPAPDGGVLNAIGTPGRASASAAASSNQMGSVEPSGATVSPDDAAASPAPDQPSDSTRPEALVTAPTGGDGGSTVTARPRPGATPRVTRSPTPRPSPSPLPTPTPGPTPASTPSPSAAQSPTPTPEPTPEPTPTPTPDPTPTPTPTPDPTPTPEPTPEL